MNLFKNSALLGFVSLALAHGALPVSAGNVVRTIGPAKGITLLVGNKRAVSYYVAGADGCNLTVMLSDIYADSDVVIPSAARVNVSVGAGTSSRVDTADGPSLTFSCASGAKSMKVETIERTAYVAASKN